MPDTRRSECACASIRARALDSPRDINWGEGLVGCQRQDTRVEVVRISVRIGVSTQMTRRWIDAHTPATMLYPLCCQPVISA